MTQQNNPRIYLEGFAVANYRSFGNETQFIGKLGKINVFIGKNNCGKSNVLRFCEHLSKVNFEGTYGGFDKDLDQNRENPQQQILFGLPIYKGGISNSIFLQIDQIVPAFPRIHNECGIWFLYDPTQLGNNQATHPTYPPYEHYLSQYPSETHRIYSLFSKVRRNNVTELREQVVRGMHNLPKLDFSFEMVEAFRSITDEDSPKGNSGKGLLKKLRQLQNPKRLDFVSSQKTWNEINNFISDILGEKAELSIPDGEDIINVQMNGRLLPLDSLGTGIHELIILAATVTFITNSVIGIEEPEIHLHPELQKKFLRYIRDNTTNQYMITSHSGAVFDIEGINIYHCNLIDGCTTVSITKEASNKFEILMDLGYKYSDLLISNCIIWVEGPSDRIYLKHWLAKIDNTLVEGLQYSIMFYGGKLLSHLDFDSPEIDSFIDLSKINRNSAILIDSDRKAKHGRINTTKKRVRDSFTEAEKFVWITQGREIENYLPNQLLMDAYKRQHGSFPTKKTLSEYENVSTLSPKKKYLNKVGLANEVCKKPADLSVLDLKSQISKLKNFILKSNGLDPTS